MPVDLSDPERAFESITRDAGKLNRPRENWIILYKGKPIALSTNGKFRWSKPQHALSALTNAWKHVFYYNYNYYGSKKTAPGEQQKWLDAFVEWRKNNIQIVRQEAFEAPPICASPLTEEEFAMLRECNEDDL